MAKEAIIKIKQAEDDGHSAIRKAGETAKQIIKSANQKADDEYKKIIDDANKRKARLIEQEAASAKAICEPLALQNEQDLKNIENPDPKKMEKTISLIAERIVNINGSC